MIPLAVSIGLSPLAVAAIAIVFLLVLILRVKLNAFLALLLASVLVGVLSDMPLSSVNASIQEGMGGALGYIATVVGLGAIFGKVLEHSGGTEAMARRLLALFGKDRASWAMMVCGFLVSIPVFLDAGLVILIPVVYALTRESGKPLLYFAIPLVAGMAVTHAFVPPTPGPVAVAQLLGAELGWVILMGCLVGFPTAVVAGPVFGAWISRRVPSRIPELMNEEGEALTALEDRELPGFGLVLALIGLPVLLMLAGSVVKTMAGADAGERAALVDFVVFIGHPFSALMLATLLALYFLGVRRGSSAEALTDLSMRALAPAGVIILITGAGGVFKQVLVDSEAAAGLADVMRDSGLPVLLLAYLLAGIVRVVQGSATVAMITAGSLLGPLTLAMGLEPSEPEKALWVIAIAAGATACSHVNDSGFWLMNRYFGQTEKQTLQSVTVMSTLISVVGFSLALVLSLFV